MQKQKEEESRWMMDSTDYIHHVFQEIESLFVQYSTYSDSRLQHLQEVFSTLKAEPLTSHRTVESVRDTCSKLKKDVKKVGESVSHEAHRQMIRNIRSSFEEIHRQLVSYKGGMETSKN